MIYQHVIFDFDSTLVTVEGIDELARKKGVYHQVSQITQLAMNGEISFDQALEERLDLIQPTKTDLAWLGSVYQQNLVAGVPILIKKLHQYGVQVSIVSGGFREAIRPSAHDLGILTENIYANELVFDSQEIYGGVDKTNPMALEGGKKLLLTQLKKQHPKQNWLMVGDGMGDWEAGQVLGNFICFAGVIERKNVVAMSPQVVYKSQLDELWHLLTTKPSVIKPQINMDYVSVGVQS